MNKVILQPSASEIQQERGQRARKEFSFLRLAVHLAGWLPLLLILYDFYTHNLTANPIQAIEQRTGRIALTLLLLSLACTPLASILGWKELIRHRRTLGLYAFMYAALHLVTFVGVDYGFNFKFILKDVGDKPYILIGLVAFVGLFALAVTSFRYWKRLLRKNWKRLHRLVYILAPLVVVHFILVVKGDITRLAGNLVQPLLYGAVLAVLLILRLPSVKNMLVRLVRK
jgi:methionine sulfoxide reductase heme-binding subunit